MGYCSELKLIPCQRKLNQNKLNYRKNYTTHLPNLALKLYFHAKWCNPLIYKMPKTILMAASVYKAMAWKTGNGQTIQVKAGRWHGSCLKGESWL